MERMGAIRIERDGESALDRVRGWLTRHRGEVLRLDGTRRVALGSPITGARAVIIAATVEDEGRPGPELGGVIRALSARTDGEPARLVFEGRAAGGLAPDRAEVVATEMLRVINRQIAEDEVAKVA